MTQKKAKSSKKDTTTPKKHITLSELTPQQDKFASYVASGNTYADAHRKAYPKSKKWSDNAVYVNSSKMMADPKIKLRVAELQAETAKRNQVTLDDVLNEMAIWLKFNVKSIFKEDGTMKALSEMTDEEASSISGYECVELFSKDKGESKLIGHLKKVKLLDKRAVADMFLKKFGAYITNMQLNVKDLSHLKGILDGIKEAE